MAVQLALSDLIAVFPVTGWWWERPRLGMADEKARYSLIVTISSDNTRLDLYNPDEHEIDIRTTVPTEVETETNEESETLP